MPDRQHDHGIEFSSRGSGGHHQSRADGHPTTGVRLPLQALREKAEQLGIEYLIVDGAQAIGMIDLTTSAESVENCDFYACPGHKWLNGPPSTGVLYIRNADIRPPEFYPTISQRMGKYTGCDDQANACFPIAEALQVKGCSNTPGFAAMIRAMVSPHSDPKLLSGLTVFFPFRWDNPREVSSDRETSAWVVSELLKRKIQLRFIGFQDAGSEGESYALRVSTAYFNTAGQIERFQDALQDVLMRVREAKGQAFSLDEPGFVGNNL
jgi:hypothetical protein